MIASNQVIEIVCEESGYSFKHLKQHDRRKEVKSARQIMHYFLTKHSKLKVTYVGFLTERDHTTVVHSRQLVTEMIKQQDSLYMPLFEKVLHRIQNVTTC